MVVCLLLSDPGALERERARGELKLNEGPFRAYKEDKKETDTLSKVRLS